MASEEASEDSDAPVVTRARLALAFGVVTGAGLATLIGGATVWCAPQRLPPRLLSAVLGAAAGVMIYVSFAEIFAVKAVEAFQKNTGSEAEAWRDATFAFFGGIALSATLNEAVHAMIRRAGLQQGGTAETKHLWACSLLSMAAFVLHNLPEGLATFVAVLSDPKIGLALAVAIAVHNVPEGIAVAVPLFYATGSRWKGFLMSFVAAAAEPVGALIGWAVLRGGGWSDLTFAILFALTAGIMVHVSVAALLPTALHHDGQSGGRLVTASVFVGMAVMAASLLLFTM